MFDMFRDPRYLLPLGVLVGVILASATLAHTNTSDATGTPPLATVEAPHTPISKSTDTIRAVATPGLDDVLLDSRRALDLARLRDAAIAYKAAHGTYPASRDVVSPVCAQPSDAGCVLSTIAPDLAYTDGKLPYWFASDGATDFVVIARAQIPTDTSQCPSPLPPALSAAPVLCLRVQGSN